MQALPHKALLSGLGLDSTELGWPPRLFKPAFDLARAQGLRCVAHAGVRPRLLLWQQLLQTKAMCQAHQLGPVHASCKLAQCRRQRRGLLGRQSAGRPLACCKPSAHGGSLLQPGLDTIDRPHAATAERIGRCRAGALSHAGQRCGASRARR